MSERVVYLNGHWVPEAEAKVSIYDSWPLQGFGCFEMTRSFLTSPFLLEAHVDRLCASIGKMGCESPAGRDLLLEICLDSHARNQGAMQKDDEHRLMISWSCGTHPIYSDTVAWKGDTLCVADFPLRWTTQGLGPAFTEGVYMVKAANQAISRHAIDPTIKHRSRFAFHHASQQAPWPLLFDNLGWIAEGPGWNIVLVRGKSLVSNGATNCLDGLSRRYLFDVAYQEGFSVLASENLDEGDLQSCDEMLITGTPFCVLPVVRYEQHRIGKGSPGPVYHQLLAAWGRNVGVDIAGQIRGWG